jgi:hypothetical protein
MTIRDRFGRMHTVPLVNREIVERRWFDPKSKEWVLYAYVTASIGRKNA